MNPRDFLDVADSLLGGISEAEWRSAVSRAYYAAFHVVRHLLVQCGFSVPDGEQAHAYLWLRLANAGHPDVQQVGSDLGAIRTVRNSADYDLNRFMHHGTAANQIQAAEDVIHLLDMVAAAPGIQGQITDAMKIYERDVLRQVTWHP
jgi:uncharacterized protein (UPF0332 family)